MGEEYRIGNRASDRSLVTRYERFFFGFRLFVEFTSQKKTDVMSQKPLPELEGVITRGNDRNLYAHLDSERICAKTVFRWR